MFCHPTKISTNNHISCIKKKIKHCDYKQTLKPELWQDVHSDCIHLPDQREKEGTPLLNVHLNLILRWREIFRVKRFERSGCANPELSKP